MGFAHLVLPPLALSLNNIPRTRSVDMMGGRVLSPRARNHSIFAPFAGITVSGAPSLLGTVTPASLPSAPSG